jgi:hypothetical protein
VLINNFLIRVLIMSAIAFYDSGRLLPLRHELKQKQIEQRNIDAENTRRYMGMAGRGFANMAEKTGTVFGARLGSTPQEKDATGAMVDVPQKYGGGTVGAKAAKAEWQKGTMDSESKRREVSHRLGLLMKHVEFGNADRQRRAWGNRDKDALEKEFNNRFTIFSEFAQDTSVQREELVTKWPDFFTKEAKVILAAINDPKADYTDKQRQEALESFRDNPEYAPIMNFMKYAAEQNWYNSKIMEEDFEGLNMLTNYLEQEVGFVGMNRHKKPDKDKSNVAMEKPDDESSGNNMKIEVEKLLGKRKKENVITGTAGDSTGAAGNVTDTKKKTLADVVKTVTDGLPEFTKKGEKINGGVAQVYHWAKNVLSDLTEVVTEKPEFQAPDINVNLLAKKIRDEADRKAYEQIANWSEETDGPFDAFEDSIKALINNFQAEVEAQIPDNKEKLEEFTEPLVKAFNSGARKTEEYLGFKEGSIYNLMSGLSDDQKRIAAARSEKEVADNKTQQQIESEMAAHAAAHGKVDKTTTYDNMTMEKLIKNTRLFEDNRKYGNKLINSGYLIDDFNKPILPGSVNLNYHLEHLPMKERIAKANKIIDMIGGFPEGSEKRRMLLEYATTDNVKKIFGFDRNVLNKNKLTEAQKAARRVIKFTPEQVDKLVDYTWRDHFKQLNNHYKFLNNKAYKDNPYLKHILGDMAYRLGPKFMDKKKYEGFHDGVRDLVAAKAGDDKAHKDAWEKMWRSVSTQYPKVPKDRFDYIKDRMDKLKGWITKGQYVGKPAVFKPSVEYYEPKKIIANPTSPLANISLVDKPQPGNVVKFLQNQGRIGN